MPSLVFRRISLLAATSLAALAVGVAQADITLKEHMAVEGEGLMSFANMSGTSSISVSGKNARTENDLQMGLVNGAQGVTDRAAAMFGRYKSAWAKVVDKMKGLKGYPVKTSFAMGFGGPQCQNNTSTQTADSGASDPSSSTSAPGGLAGQIAGSLFGRKKKPQAEAAAPTTPATPTPAALNGMIMPLKITSELLSVSKDSLGADTFQPPAGFKKISE